MFRMARVAERGKKLRITVNSSDILRRPRSLPADAARVPFLRERRKDGLDHHAVLPPITEIVDVGEFASLLEPEVAEAYSVSVLRRLLGVFVSFRIGLGKPPVPYFELVEVRVGPANPVLDDQVERVKRGIAENAKTPPNQRLGPCQLDLQLIRLRGSCRSLLLHQRHSRLLVDVPGA
jgi:hypothetical protein